MIRKFTVKLIGRRDDFATLIQTVLQDCDITFLNDGSNGVIVTTEKPLGQIKQMLTDYKISPLETTRTDIPHRADSKGNMPVHTKLKKWDLE